jgi:hypothetical protein
MTPEDYRFERDDKYPTGAKVRNRAGAAGGDDRPGDFLGRLWGLFGPPDSVDGAGFTYNLRDRWTGLRFSAYWGASGAAYAGAPTDAEPLRPVLQAFDELLDRTAPADCVLDLHGEHAELRVGASGGRPFETWLPPPPQSIRTALYRAAEILRNPQAVPWENINALLELVSARERMEAGPKVALEGRFRPVAKELWAKAFISIEDLIQRAARQGSIDPGSLETLADVALVQLVEIAPSVIGAEFDHYQARYEQARRLAEDVLEGRRNE